MTFSVAEYEARRLPTRFIDSFAAAVLTSNCESLIVISIDARARE